LSKKSCRSIERLTRANETLATALTQRLEALAEAEAEIATKDRTIALLEPRALRADRMLNLLRSIQWHEPPRDTAQVRGSGGYCPSCKNGMFTGHDDTCRLATELMAR